jgi:Glycine-zipper domain
MELDRTDNRAMKTSTSRFALAGALCSVALLSACVTVPTGPTVMVLPGTNKNFDQFQADGYACNQYAQQFTGGAGQAAANNAAGNAVVGSLLGAAAGAAIGSVGGNAGAGAAIGAGTGLLFGSAAGANSAGYSNYQMQRQYDQLYMQCMYAKGNQVPTGGPYNGPYPYPPRMAPPPPGYYPPPAG